jgi:hypothetical protein
MSHANCTTHAKMTAKGPVAMADAGAPSSRPAPYEARYETPVAAQAKEPYLAEPCWRSKTRK